MTRHNVYDVLDSVKRGKRAEKAFLGVSSRRLAILVETKEHEPAFVFGAVQYLHSQRNKTESYLDEIRARNLTFEKQTHYRLAARSIPQNGTSILHAAMRSTRFAIPRSRAQVHRVTFRFLVSVCEFVHTYKRSLYFVITPHAHHQK